MTGNPTSLFNLFSYWATDKRWINRTLFLLEKIKVLMADQCREPSETNAFHGPFHPCEYIHWQHQTILLSMIFLNKCDIWSETMTLSLPLSFIFSSSHTQRTRWKQMLWVWLCQRLNLVLAPDYGITSSQSRSWKLSPSSPFNLNSLSLSLSRPHTLIWKIFPHCIMWIMNITPPNICQSA